MAMLLLFVVAVLALTGRSSAIYCVCRDGVGDTALQKNLDFACGNGGDCTPILQNGGCYQPNTLKAHCDYAVNSYYQKKASLGATCDFGGTATITSSISNQASLCVYPASSSTTSITPTPTTPTTTPTTSATPGSSITPPTTTTPSTTTPITGTTTPTTSTPVFNTGTTGLGPTGTDSYSNAQSLIRVRSSSMWTTIMTFLFSLPVWFLSA